MSKKPLELYVVLGEPPESVLVGKVWMESKGDLYAVTHGHPLAGKYSYLESGMDHHYTDLIGRRSGAGQPTRPRLRGLQGFGNLTSWMIPTPPQSTGYESRKDSKTRRTLTVPAPRLGWDLAVWAIERGRQDIVKKIAETDPWPDIPVVATLLADWSDPWILLTVAYWQNDHPYEVVRIEP